MNLLNEKYVFQKRKRILWNSLWTAGSTSKVFQGLFNKITPRRGIGRSGPLDLKWMAQIRWERRLAREEAPDGGAMTRKDGISPALRVRATPAIIWLGTGTKRKRSSTRAYLGRRWRRWRFEEGGRHATADGGGCAR